MVRRTHARRLALTLAVLMPVTAGLIAAGGPSGADVTGVTGSAFGVSIQNLRLFGGLQSPIGPAPVVTLPPNGTLQTLTVPSEVVAAGPATFFESGTETVSTQGTLGPTGSVTSSAMINAISNAHGEQFTADSLSATCTASQTGVTGSTTITNGQLVTATDASQNPTTTVNVPTNPAPNTMINGSFVLSPTDTESFTWVFNEQVTNADGSITVTAAHEILHGPTATGDLYIGQVTCGVTGTVTTTSSTSSTLPATTSTSSTLPATTSTSSTLPATTSTSSTLPATTSTTRPATTTTSSTLPFPTTTIGNGTTTTIRPGATCAQIQAIGAQFNAQIDAVRASIVQSVPADQQATILAILDAVRAQGNAQIAQLLATC
jgi:hypothetical protein